MMQFILICGGLVSQQIEVATILALHEKSIITWKAAGDVLLSASGFLRQVEENHAFNYRLWHTEDKARREDKGHTFVYEAKRAIDGFNQKRNDAMEAIDDVLMHLLKPAAPEICPVHSETPGMMIDRLSILALKKYHMNLQTIREDVDEAHHKQCVEKLKQIEAQQTQLASCLQDLLTEVVKQTRTFRVYRQFKMYNSAALNPELYQA